MKLCSSALLVVLFCVCDGYEDVLLTLPGLGTLRGGRGRARNNDEFYSFQAVPFAAPPIGERRFRPPAPVEPWEGNRDATEHADVCMQNNYEDPTKVTGSEDCLYLNVFTKSLNTSSKSQVIFYIHGGAFIFGGSDHLGPEYMLEEDVVLVTIQYRLNAFGFLSTEDETSPGNYGLHDQVAALHWVQDNILYFGGDPGRVTIMGLSAGGASVHYLLLSPLTKGLFHKAVAFSGAAFCWWANLPKHAPTAHRLAVELDCPVESSKNMLDCMRAKTAEELMSAQLPLYHWHTQKLEREPMNVWSPRSDSEAGDAAFLPLPPHTAMKAGQMKSLPFLVGIAEAEGIWRGINYVGQEEVMKEMVENFDSIGIYALGLEDDVAEGKMDEVMTAIKTKYIVTDTENYEEAKVVRGLIDALGDTMFNYPVDEMVKLHLDQNHSPLWMFTISYQHSHSLATLMGKEMGYSSFDDLRPELREATHGAEMSLMFPRCVHKLGPLSEEETQASREIISLLVEFSENGAPGKTGVLEDWKPVTHQHKNHLDIGTKYQLKNGLPFQEQLKFWNDLPIYWKKTDKNENYPGEFHEEF